ncbi:MAG: hypothetical protein OQK95_11850, partial [Gammaproteobacteria bacterium]|nr:hypothetical protein [Gammaproteobacteria bacterium]
MKLFFPFTVVIVSLLLNPISTYALTINEQAQQQSEQVLREQQQQLKLEERKRNLEELERSLFILEPRLPTEKVAPELDKAICFDITSIELKGA